MEAILMDRYNQWNSFAQFDGTFDIKIDLFLVWKALLETYFMYNKPSILFCIFVDFGVVSYLSTKMMHVKHRIAYEIPFPQSDTIKLT